MPLDIRPACDERRQLLGFICIEGNDCLRGVDPEGPVQFLLTLLIVTFIVKFVWWLVAAVAVIVLGWWVVRGLGSATASKPVSHHETATEDHPCGRSSVFSGSADQLSVHDVGQAGFQAAHGFVVIFAFGSFPQVVSPAGGIVADLGDGHDVEAEIELAIASAGKPVAHHLAGGHLGGGGAGVTGERGGRLEYRRRYYTGL